MSHVPVVLKWEINANLSSILMESNSSHSTCQFANGSSSLGNMSSTFTCSCDPGFEGNPYLVDGCHEIFHSHGKPFVMQGGNWQQGNQFSSSLKAAPFSAKGEDVIFVLGFDEGRKSNFRGAKEVSSCPALVWANPRAGSLENIQLDMKVTVEEGSNKCREPLNAETVSMGKTKFERDRYYFPNQSRAAELFDIQIKEINEALIKFGKQTDGEIRAKEASNAEITPQNQCDEAKEGSEACEVGLVQARGQLQGSGRVHA
ncbi:hypothetical protein CFP56_034682 [Quercus suber]|uniref:Uncharacterized protein n=1 Tax=Quercus suber TaxID=58331 RepID=A0AAW0JC50_QUESU